MIKQYKDKKLTEYKIKVYTLREYFRDDNMYYFGDDMKWCCDIDNMDTIISFCANSKEELFKKIMEEVLIKKKSFWTKLKELFK
jgi:hypothetical protein